MENNFDKNMKRLGEISEKMKSNTVTIQESIDLFKEAIEISKKCIEFLQKTKGEIELLKEAADQIIATPFEIDNK